MSGAAPSALHLHVHQAAAAAITRTMLALSSIFPGRRVEEGVWYEREGRRRRGREKMLVESEVR